MAALARRLRPGDIAVIDVLDLDQTSAAALVARRPAAVINIKRSISGRYPNGGPAVVAAAGIPLIDDVGAQMRVVRDGTHITLRGGDVLTSDAVVASGIRLDAHAVTTAMAEAAQGMQVQMAAFTANAMDLVAQEAGLILEGQGLPELSVDVQGRHVLVVAAGFEHRDQLRAIRHYVRDHRPVIVGVGEGADAAVEIMRRIDIVIGDIDAVQERTLTAAAQVVLHDPRGEDTGRARVDALSLTHSVATSALSSVDLAILMAHAGHAEVIVTAGIEGSLLEMLESHRPDAAGTFLSRLQAGASIVEARTVARVYRHRFSAALVTALLVAGVTAVVVAVWATPGGRMWLTDLWESATAWIGGA